MNPTNNTIDYAGKGYSSMANYLRYPLLVETKGGQASFIAKTIVITSNALPRAGIRMLEIIQH